MILFPLSFAKSVSEKTVVPAHAGTHNHQCLFWIELRPGVMQHTHLWLWVPARARFTRLAGTTEMVDSNFKQQKA